MKKSRRALTVLVLIAAIISLSVAVFGIVAGAASGPITNAPLTDGRAFEDGEGIQLGQELGVQPRTYEFVVYVPTDVAEKGSILSNFFPIGGASHIDLNIGSNGRPTLDIKQQLTADISARTQATLKQDLRGSWVHVAITHQLRATELGGDIYTFYVNGEKISSSSVSLNYWAYDETEGKTVSMPGANLSHDLDMSKMEIAASLYLGQAAGYSSKTELGADDPYNEGGAYVPTNFKGRIKNLALYSNVLTDSEIKANYQSGIDEKREGIILCYDLTSTATSGETKSGYITDLSGNGYNTVPLYHERTEELNNEDFDYSFALLGDTQFLVDWDLKNGTSYYTDIYTWIINNKDAKKIARVLGVGDIVESGRLDDKVTDEATREFAIEQWLYAQEQFKRLEDAGIPYSITFGYSHDGYEGTEFTTYFGNQSNFTDKTVGKYDEIGFYFGDENSADYSKRLANYYQKFEVEGVKYMVLCIEFMPGDAVLEWADSVIDANPDHRVIISTHYFLDHLGEISDDKDKEPKQNNKLRGEILQAKWDRLANENANVEMIICGHVARQNNIVQRYTVAKSGQMVAQFLIDPQQLDRFLGYDDTSLVAMLYFSNGGQDVRVEFVSTSRTMRAVEENPEAEDILYGHANQFNYTYDIPIEDKGEIDIYIIAGQSNAVGYGYNDLTVEDDRFTDGFENVLYFGQQEYYGKDDITAFIPVKTGLGQGTGRSGAEIGIAYKVNDNGRVTAVIKCAWGATPLYPIEGNSTLESKGSWTPPSFIEKYPELDYHEMVGYLYEKLIETLDLGLNKLESTGYRPVIKGVWWMQGEADSGKETVANTYEEILTDLINDLRSDLSDITGKDCSATPFVMGKITSNHISVPAYVDVVCQAQADVANTLDKVYVLDTTGLDQQDGWHYTAESQRIIGEKFVEIVSKAHGNYPTAYGEIPAGSYDPVNYPFAVFSEGKYIASFATWKEAVTAIHVTYGIGVTTKQMEIVLLSDVFPADTSNSSDSNKGLVYDNACQIGGTLIIDLNGFTLSTGYSGQLLSGVNKTKAVDNNFIFKNGELKIHYKQISTYSIRSSQYSKTKTANYTFDKVKFSFAEGTNQSYLVASVTNDSTNDTDTSKILNLHYVFNDCTFDLVTNATASDSKLFNFAQNSARGQVNATVELNGGRIIESACTTSGLYSEGTGDTVTFGKYNGKYTEVELPTGVAPSGDVFSATSGYTGKLKLAKSATLTATDLYEFVEVTTKYGDIPDKYLSIESYPFIVFVFDGDTLLTSKTKGYATPYREGAIAYAKAEIAANDFSNGGKATLSAVMLQRRDYTMLSTDTYWDMAQIRGSVIHDLGGYTLSQSTEDDATSIFILQSKPWASYDVNEIAPTRVSFINGNMVTYTKSIIEFRAKASSSTNYTISDKIFEVNFEDITFSLGKGSTVTTLINSFSSTTATTEQDPNPNANFDLNLKDCHIDLYRNGTSSAFSIFNLSASAANAMSVDATVIGCTIRGRKWDGSGDGANLKLARGTFTNGSRLFVEKSDATGKYLNVLLTHGADAPEDTNVFYTKSGKELTFALIKNTEVYSRYDLGESTVTKYGNIKYADGGAAEYPFALFVYPAGSNKATLVGVYKELLGAGNGVFNEAKAQLTNNEWNGSYDGQIKAIIVLRRDYTLGEGEYYSNFAQIRGEIVLDLNGNTLSQYSSSSAKPLFNLVSKPWGSNGTSDGHADVFPSTITIENGTVLTYNEPIFKLGMSSTTESPESLSNKLFTVNLNGVTVGLKEGATTSSLLFNYNGGKSAGSQAHDKDNAPFEFNFTDCVFDLNTVDEKVVTIFNMDSSSNYITNSVNVIGGEIKALSLGDIILHSTAKNGSSLTFKKSDALNYTAMTLNIYAEAPEYELNGLVFVKISETDSTVTYRLRPKAAAEITFAPMASVTLDSNLVFNIYIPDDNRITAVTLNGTPVVLENAEGGYYLVSTELSANEGAKTLTLVVTLDLDGTSVNGTFTFSTVKYVEKLLTMDSVTETEKTLAKDMLAYVKSAYSYFDSADKATVAEEINAVIGNYDKAFSKVEGAGADADDIIAGVTFVLESTPAIRFYLPEGASLDGYSFKIGNTALEIADSGIETAGDCAGLTYADISLYAYRMIETITIANGANTATYHINEYYDGMDKSDTALADIVEKFYNYCVSANNYRNYILANK